MKVGLLLDITENYKEKIHHAKELGFDFGQLVMWDMDFYNDENLKGLKETLEKENFKATAFWCGWSGPVKWSYPEMYSSLGLVPEWLRAKRLDDLKRGAKFAYDLGIDLVATHTGYLPDNPNDPTHIAIVLALKELCSELKARGQRFAFETGEELPITLSLLIKEIGLDNVGVNFDPANFISLGRGNPNDAMELLGSKVFGMHAKDAVPPKFGDEKGRQVLLGEGRVNFPLLFKQLKEAGYTGDIVIERETPHSEQRDRELIHSKKLLETMIEEVY